MLLFFLFLVLCSCPTDTYTTVLPLFLLPLQLLSPLLLTLLTAKSYKIGSHDFLLMVIAAAADLAAAAAAFNTVAGTDDTAAAGATVTTAVATTVAVLRHIDFATDTTAVVFVP